MLLENDLLARVARNKLPRARELLEMTTKVDDYLEVRK